MDVELEARLLVNAFALLWAEDDDPRRCPRCGGLAVVADEGGVVCCARCWYVAP